MLLLVLESYYDKVKDTTPKRYETSFNEKRLFILISTVMTWANSKPVDPDDPEVNFVETDFKKRKPHPNYKDHIDIEKEVMLKGKKVKYKPGVSNLCSAEP